MLIEISFIINKEKRKMIVFPFKNIKAYMLNFSHIEIVYRYLFKNSFYISKN